MPPLLRPPRLAPGDLVGIVSPSSAVAAQVPRRFDRGVAELERRGFRVRVGEHARSATGWTAGTPADRAADLQAMFADPEVRAIVCTIGGYNANQLLELLDFDLIAANPKLFVGYSDITALHGAIHARTGLATMIGPALLPQWGEYGGIDDYTWSAFERVATRAEPAGVLRQPQHWYPERLWWDTEDDRPRAPEPAAPWRTVRAGRAEGPIVAGNLDTLRLLIGTSWEPALDGALLCIEADEEYGKPWMVERELFHLRHLGVFDRVSGLAHGRMHPESGFERADSIDEILLRATAGTEIPVATGLDFSHTDPLLTLPWGVRARLAADAEVTLELLDAAVVERDL
ncbi:MAG: muramoyltetrapeptide carboxypeptidase [Gaiellaceae bacterium]|nr:muramoyltetrapeptide carboxypeptidase [Gaiellaceae bacterium]